MLLIAALLLLIGILLVLICLPIYHVVFYYGIPQYRQATDEWRAERKAKKTGIGS